MDEDVRSKSSSNFLVEASQLNHHYAEFGDCKFGGIRAKSLSSDSVIKRSCDVADGRLSS